MKTEKYLIRFFRVGNGSKGGDAILLRLFDEFDNEHIVLIDGGYKETGSIIANYIKKICSTQHVDVVINTHPDRDHISGLITVFEDDDITVGNLVLNRPWRDAKFTKEMFEDDRITNNSLIKRLKDAFCLAEELESLAKEKAVQIFQGIEGTKCYDGVLTVLGPSENLYKRGLLGSDKTPETYIESGFVDYLPHKYTEEDYVKGKVIEWFDDEQTSAVNQTSLVIALKLGNYNVLFTGDAGKEALNSALDYYEKEIGKAADFSVVQLPHHGSRKNIDPAIIGRLGNPEFIISCPPDGEREGHPSRRLINKILEIKPQARIYVTKQNNFNFYKNLIVPNCSIQTPASAKSRMDGK